MLLVVTTPHGLMTLVSSRPMPLMARHAWKSWRRGVCATHLCRKQRSCRCHAMCLGVIGVCVCVWVFWVGLMSNHVYLLDCRFWSLKHMCNDISAETWGRCKNQISRDPSLFDKYWINCHPIWVIVQKRRERRMGEKGFVFQTWMSWMEIFWFWFTWRSLATKRTNTKKTCR